MMFKKPNKTDVEKTTETTPKPIETKTSDTFNSLLKDINKRYGGMTIVNAKTSAVLNRRNRIKTGIFAFDLALGGGIPTGTITTIKGEYSSGKSAISHKIASAFQRVCRNCGNPLEEWNESKMQAKLIHCCDQPERMRVVWFDAEGSFDNNWASRLGMHLDSTFVIRTEFAEQGIDVADTVLRSGDCDLLVLDSVAQLTPSTEIENSAEKWQQGLLARLMNKAMRKWVSAQNAGSLNRAYSPTILLINQVRLNIGVMYGNPETSPGGKGIEFASSVILRCKRKGYKMNNVDMPIGHEMEIAIQKNKTAPPNRSCELTIHIQNAENYRAGSTDEIAQVIAHAEKWGVIERKGAWYQLSKDHKAQGIEQSSILLAETPALLQAIKDATWQAEMKYLGNIDDE